MKIYLAGFDPGITENVQELLKQRGHKLHSYYYVHVSPGSETTWFHQNIKDGVDIFLDSGAFSAMTQGIEINIQEYIDFVKQYERSLTVYANLDVIGVDGRPPDRESAERGIQNQRIMEKAGLSPIPIFHFREPFDILQKYVEEYDYIALGGAVGYSPAVLRLWLDQCFRDHICDPKTGLPKVKVHGFGITSIPLLLRYPWYSVDSSTWALGGRLGLVFIPKRRQGEWIYNEDSWRVTISNKSAVRSGEHLEALPPQQRQIVMDYIHSKGYTLGKSRFTSVPQSHKLAENERWAERKPKDPQALRRLEILDEPGLSNDYRIRNEFNMRYFLDLQESLPKWPRPFRVRGMRTFM